MASSIDDSKAPLLEHLIELRTRLIRSAAVLLSAFFACFYVAGDIFEVLVKPLADQLGPGRKMIFTELHEVFFTYVKVAFFAGLFISFPLIANQMWQFIAPGPGSSSSLSKQSAPGVPCRSSLRPRSTSTCLWS